MGNLSLTWEDCKEVLDGLIDKYNLKKDERIGLLVLWFEKNIGDAYFLSASLSYAQKIVGKRCIVISPKRFTIQKFIGWQNANGAGIECECITEEQESIIRPFHNKIEIMYPGILDVFNVSYRRFPVRQVNPTDVYRNLTRPKFPPFDKNKYIEKYGVIPGKTIFVIPEANYHGTLPLYFWIMSIEIFKLLGFKVIVNAKNGTKKYGDVSCYLIPLDDLVEFCNLCGTVYSIKTGLSEFLAAEIKAKMFIFSLPGSVQKVFRSVTSIYQHIDNSDGHIKEITLPVDKSEFFWIRNATDVFRERMGNLQDNFFLLESLYTEKFCKRDKQKTVEKPLFYRRRYDDKWFIDSPGERCSSFCTVSYYISKCNARIHLRLDIRPYMNYIIHIALKNKNTNKIVHRYEYYNSNSVFFDPDEDGEYCAVVHIMHPESRKNCVFETETFRLYRSLEDKLRRCKKINNYINLLSGWQSDFLIFITASDAIANPWQNNNTDLSALHISTDFLKTFRYSWLCVIDSGNVVKELISKNKEVSYDYEWCGNRAHITSMGYNVNNSNNCPVKVEINGGQVCVNQRGINFVIWDKRDNKLLDSVCFDTFFDGYASRCFNII